MENELSLKEKKQTEEKGLSKMLANFTEKALKSPDPTIVKEAEENIDCWRKLDGKQDTPTNILSILRERGLID